MIQDQINKNQVYWEIMEEFEDKLGSFKKIHDEVEDLIKFSKLLPNSNVFNLECGIGLYSVLLAKKGFNVFASESRYNFFAKAQINIQEFDLNVKLCHQKLGDFNYPPRSFDLITFLGCTFGIANSLNEDRVLLEKIFITLSLNGVFILELIGREALQSHFQQQGWIILNEENTLLWERSIHLESNSLNETVILLKNSHKIEANCQYRLYYIDELVNLLEEIGFVNINFYENLKKMPYSNNSSQLFIFAEKCLNKSLLVKG